MIETLVQSLAERQAQDGDLGAVPGTEIFQAFLRSPLLREKLRRFDDTTYRPSETAGLYSDSVIVHVFDQQGWSAILIRHTGVPKLIYSLPFPTLIGLALPGSTATIETFGYPRALDRDPGLGSGCKAVRGETIELTADRFWSPKREAPAYRLVDYSTDAIFLRITGPVYAPYSHAFEPESLDYRHSGFSHQDVTCRDVLYRLALAAAQSGAFARFSASESAAVAELMAQGANAPLCAPNSAWAAIEALSHLDPERAEAEVRRLAVEDGPLRDVARRTLDSVA